MCAQNKLNYLLQYVTIDNNDILIFFFFGFYFRRCTDRRQRGNEPYTLIWHAGPQVHGVKIKRIAVNCTSELKLTIVQQRSVSYLNRRGRYTTTKTDRPTATHWNGSTKQCVGDRRNVVPRRS